jgi:hypothetical protein
MMKLPWRLIGACKFLTFWYLAMGKRVYREWTPTEEARLPHWIVLHPDSEWSWDMRAKEYSETILPRAGMLTV